MSDSKSSYATLVVHRCRFSSYLPSGIADLTASNDESQIAVGREAGIIEIWKMVPMLYQCITLPSYGPIRRIKYLTCKSENVYSESFLLTSGLDGFLRFRDLTKIVDPFEFYMGCGPIWDMCLIPRSKHSGLVDHEGLIVAGDDGTVRVIMLPMDELSHLTPASMAFCPQLILNGPTKRTLCVSVFQRSNPNSLCVWAGSADGNIYRWDLNLNLSEQGLIGNSSSPTLTISIGKGVLPWSLLVDHAENVDHMDEDIHSIIVGDSLGQISVWDGEIGTQIQLLSHHKADVLRLASSPDVSILFSVGVDNTIFMYQKPSSTEFSAVGTNQMVAKKNFKWTFTAKSRIHTHDILAALALSDRLFTGGVDNKLIMSMYSDSLGVPGRAIDPFPQSPALCASLPQNPILNRANRIIIQLMDRLQVWRLARTWKELPDSDGLIRAPYILEKQILILEIAPKIHGNIYCHASDYKLHTLAVSDSEVTKVFYLRERNIADGQEPILTVENKYQFKFPSARVIFTLDGKLVTASWKDCLIRVWNVSDPTNIILEHTFSPQDSLFGCGIIVNFIIGGKFLAASDLEGRAWIFDLEKYSIFWKLPIFEQQVVSMAFNEDQTVFAVALSNKVLFYDMKTKDLIPWSAQYSSCIPEKLSKFPEQIVGVIFHPNHTDIIFVYGHTYILRIRTSNPPKKMFKIITSYHPLFAQFMDNETMAVIERPWVQLQGILPPPFYRKRFAT